MLVPVKLRTRRGAKRAAASVIALGASLLACPAFADANLTAKRSTAYYVANTSVAGATLVGAAVLDTVLRSGDEPARTGEWFGFEEPVQSNMSATAAAWSDRLGLLTVATPVFAEIGGGTDRTLANHGIVYGETLGVQLLLNVGVKHLVRRARPYTHNTDPRVLEFRQGQGNEANLSFYSGHSSTAFAAAMAGSYLFAAKSADPWSRRVVWFSEFGLAASTAHLRVRAGMHYYSDVIVGTLVGAGIGLGIPYLQGERYRPDASEYIAAASGFALGALLPLLVSTDDVRLPWGNTGAKMQFTPWMPPDGAGVMASGAF
jgi:membrane-associated phospholipid phosphatase